MRSSLQPEYPTGYFWTRKILLSIHIEVVRVRLSGLAMTKEDASLGSLIADYKIASLIYVQRQTPSPRNRWERNFPRDARKYRRARYIILRTMYIHAMRTTNGCPQRLHIVSDDCSAHTLMVYLAPFLPSRPNEDDKILSREFLRPFFFRIFTLLDVVLAQLFS